MRPDLHPAAGPVDTDCRCRPPGRRPTGPYAMAYFASIGPKSGPILGRHRLLAVAVLLTPGARIPVGVALADGRADDQVETWTLTVQGFELPGKWVVLAREFIPAEEPAP